MSVPAGWEAREDEIRRARPPLSWQLTRDAARILSDRDIAAQAGHEVCLDCGWCVTCDGHNMYCAAFAATGRP